MITPRPSPGKSTTASSALVNRTHRIVRERAVSLQQRKSRVRSLWIPLGISAGFLSLISFAVWSIFDQNDATPNGLPDASSQIFVFLMWCLPLSIAVLAVVWTRLNARAADEGGR